MTNDEKVDETAVPTGLVLFAPGTSSAKRTRRMLFMVAWLAVSASLIWPLYPMIAGRLDPRLFALPFSLGWIVITLTIMFVALLALFIADERAGKGES
ncbi:MAG: hypothetical protein AAGD38_07095 [Acidobacteriota bacterium]